MIKIGIGQDSHRFTTNDHYKPLVLGGIVIPEHKGLVGNSDADVVLHAVTNAISSITGVNILGRIADDMCQSGITNSKAYVVKALKYGKNLSINHVAISIECKTPILADYIPGMKKSIAAVLSISQDNIGITATTGEGMTPFGQGLGISVICILTASMPFENEIG